MPFRTRLARVAAGAAVLALLGAAVPRSSTAAEPIILLEHWTNFR